MTRARLLLGLTVVGISLFAASAAANPPYKSSIYTLCIVTTNPCPDWGIVRGQLVTGPDGDQQGPPQPALAPGSSIEVPCVNGATTLFIVHTDLSGQPINNPAGIMNVFPTANTKYDPTTDRPYVDPTLVPPGTLTGVRFFMHWYPEVPSAPTQTPPTGNPGGSYTLPAPAEFGNGSFGGRNNPPNARNQSQFCTFSVNFYARMVSTG